jgi:hypothetical protein
MEMVTTERSQGLTDDARSVVPSDASAITNALRLKESAKKLPVHYVERYFPRMKPRQSPVFVLDGVPGELTVQSFLNGMQPCRRIGLSEYSEVTL